MIKKLTYPLLLLILTGLLYSGCVKNETCLPASNLLLIDFYTQENDSTKIELSVDSISMFIIGREDSVLYDNAKGVKSISIPLSDSLNFMTVVIKINDAIDTIYLGYRPYSVFRSTECGVINRYETWLPEFTKNRIEKIELKNKDIDENEAVNLFMFLDLS